MTPNERGAPGRTAPPQHYFNPPIMPHRLRAVHRLHVTARACGLDAVFTDEAPLRCEVFDASGRLCGTWRARQ